MSSLLEHLMRGISRLGRIKVATSSFQRSRVNAEAEPWSPPTAVPAESTPAATSAGEVSVPDPAIVAPAQTLQTDAPTPVQSPVAPPASEDADQFLRGKHTEGPQTGRYWLYVPPGAGTKPLPLVVMLHGCKQDPEDFAAGTAMNARARELGFFVVYPEQSGVANPGLCWNWFSPRHQQRGSGEPALLAGITRKIMKQRGIDPRRVYIAGLSAGGAMAAIMAAAYPDVFAAAGVHSGLPPGAASNIADALTSMRSGERGNTLLSVSNWRRNTAAASGHQIAPVPTIVFHGDADGTVHPRNGELVLAAALRSVRDEVESAPANTQVHAETSTSADSDRSTKVHSGVSTQGVRYTRSTHHDDRGRVLAEHWVVHGAGHAWSGGDTAGSYTDAAGPDATREMLRFFFAHPQPDNPTS